MQVLGYDADAITKITELAKRIYKVNCKRVLEAARKFSDDEVKQKLVLDSYAVHFMRSMAKSDPNFTRVWGYDADIVSPEEALLDRIERFQSIDNSLIFELLKIGENLVQENQEFTTKKITAVEDLKNGMRLVFDLYALNIFKTIAKSDYGIFMQLAFYPDKIKAEDLVERRLATMS